MENSNQKFNDDFDTYNDDEFSGDTLTCDSDLLSNASNSFINNEKEEEEEDEDEELKILKDTANKYAKLNKKKVNNNNDDCVDEVEDVIDILEERSELFLQLSAEQQQNLLSFFLSKITPGYTLHERTFELIVQLKDEKVFCDLNMDLTGLKVGYMYQHVMERKARKIREKKALILNKLLELFHTPSVALPITNVLHVRSSKVIPSFELDELNEINMEQDMLSSKSIIALDDSNSSVDADFSLLSTESAVTFLDTNKDQSEEDYNEDDELVLGLLQEQVRSKPHSFQKNYVSLACKEVQESEMTPAQLLVDYIDWKYIHNYQQQLAASFHLKGGEFGGFEIDQASSTSTDCNTQVDITDKELRNKHFTISCMVIGKNGVGKSTLTNEFLRLRGDDKSLEKAGGARGTTDLTPKQADFRSTKYGNVVTVQFIDMPGLELNVEKQNKVLQDCTQRWIQGLSKREGSPPALNAVIYCLTPHPPRIDDIEQQYIRTIAQFVPVFVLYTRAATKSQVKDFDAWFENKTELPIPLPLESRFPVLAKREAGGDSIEAYGMPRVARTIAKLYTKSMDMHAQLWTEICSQTEEDVLRRRKKARTVIYTAFCSAGGVGAAPIPFADLPIIAAIQYSMICGIGMCYGISMASHMTATITSAMLGAGTFSLMGRAGVRVMLSFFKGIPIMNVGASIISAAVASGLTLTLGLIYQNALETVRRKHPFLIFYDQHKIEEEIAAALHQSAEEEAKRNLSDRIDVVKADANQQQ